MMNGPPVGRGMHLTRPSWMAGPDGAGPGAPPPQHAPPSMPSGPPSLMGPVPTSLPPPQQMRGPPMASGNPPFPVPGPGSLMPGMGPPLGQMTPQGLPGQQVLMPGGPPQVGSIPMAGRGIPVGPPQGLFLPAGQPLPHAPLGVPPAPTPQAVTQPLPVGSTAAIPAMSTSVSPSPFTDSSSKAAIATSTQPSTDVTVPSAGGAQASVWSQHSTPDGRAYWFNKVTSESVWQKPDALKSPEEVELANCPWKEYISDSGVKYYYNSITKESVWEMPQEFKKLVDRIESRQKQRDDVKQVPTTHTQPMKDETKIVTTTQPKNSEEMPKFGDAHASNVSTAAVSETKNVPTRQALTYASKEEATKAFRALLEENEINSSWSWERAMKVIINDRRYNALKTLGERKHAFTEFLAQKKKQEREIDRKRRQKLKDEFMVMLENRSASKEISSRTSWRTAQRLLANEDAFVAVENEREREDLWDDFVYDLEKKEKEEERRFRKEALTNFKELLLQDDSITVRTQWRKIKEQFLAADPLFREHLSHSDALIAFDAHIRELEHREEEQRRLKREEQKVESRRRREAFRSMLSDKYLEQAFDMRTRWRDFRPLIKEEPRYVALHERNYIGSSSSELFAEFIEDLEEKYSRDRHKLKEILKSLDPPVTISVTSVYEDFETTVTSSALFKDQGIVMGNVKLYFEELLEQAREDISERENRRKKHAQNFVMLLAKKHRQITGSSTWEEAREVLVSEPDFEGLVEDDRHRIFEEYVIALRGREAKEASANQSNKTESTEKEVEKGVKQHRDSVAKDGELSRKRARPEGAPESGEEQEEGEIRPKEHKRHKEHRHKKHHRHKAKKDKDKKDGSHKKKKLGSDNDTIPQEDKDSDT